MEVPEPRTVNVRPSESDMIAGMLYRSTGGYMRIEGEKLGKL